MYTELWFQFYDYKVFDGLTNQINARLFSDYKISDYVAVGPETRSQLRLGRLHQQQGRRQEGLQPTDRSERHVLEPRFEQHADDVRWAMRPVIRPA